MPLPIDDHQSGASSATLFQATKPHVMMETMAFVCNEAAHHAAQVDRRLEQG